MLPLRPKHREERDLQGKSPKKLTPPRSLSFSSKQQQQQQQQQKTTEPFAEYYYSSQFAPLVVFFLIYLCVVRNKKFHHFVRFHAMQATMLDIVGMIFQILRGYFPQSILMSPVVDFYDTLAYSLCIFPVLYCIYYALTYVFVGFLAGVWRKRESEGRTKPFTHRPLLRTRLEGGRAD